MIYDATCTLTPIARLFDQLVGANGCFGFEEASLPMNEESSGGGLMGTVWHFPQSPNVDIYLED